MKRKSKREMVLDIYDREAMGEVTAREIAIINQALVEEFGAGGAMNPGEIARVLVDEDLPVRYEQIFRMAGPMEKYENLFRYLPRIADMAQAAASIREIDALYRKFQRLGDKTGLRFARRIALMGKHEAGRLARIADHERRDEKAEIAQWFTVWLQNPDLFEHWLLVRQATQDYRNRFTQTDPGT
ncbi:MAG: hypothetical protein HYR56_04080 [Acidobacteria bacterium]|nr:hypothetical protein [Acidobacteriota bacterium]MBI3426591.1 hypothetical protein [Acidobacteriota bacterium]